MLIMGLVLYSRIMTVVNTDAFTRMPAIALFKAKDSADTGTGTVASPRALASLKFRKQQFEVSSQPELYGQAFLATPAYQSIPSSKGNLSYKEYLEQNGIAPNEGAWETWNSIVKVNNIDRPNGTVVKLMLMTKDEGSLLKLWIVYHGELLGYENLYILDGSIEPNTTSFLADTARDQWGVNVIFTPSKFNELEQDLNFVGGAIAKASDVIMKLDTDEFLALDTQDNNCSVVGVDERRNPHCRLSRTVCPSTSRILPTCPDI
jgi:hypothetical protein